MFPTGSAIIADAFPPSEHAKVLGIYGACMGIGLAAGTVLGGLITAFLSWRWIFFINIPTLFVSLLICISTLRESKLTQKISIDWLGMVLFIIALASIVFGLSMGRDYGWASMPILVAWILAVISSICLVRVENRAKDPLLPFHLLTNHGFQAGAWVYAVCVGFSWVVIFLTPLYLQDVIGLNTLQTGLMLIPMTAMTILFPAVAGHLYNKLGARKTLLLMFASSVFAFALFLFVSPESSIIFLILVFFVYGASWGMGNGVGTPLAIAQLENSNDVGVVAGAVLTVLNIAGVVALALATTVFSYAENGYLAHLLKQTAISLSADQIHAIRMALVDPDQAKQVIQQIAPQQAQQLFMLFQHAFNGAFRVVMGLLLVLSAISAPFALHAAKFLRRT